MRSRLDGIGAESWFVSREARTCVRPRALLWQSRIANKTRIPHVPDDHSQPGNLATCCRIHQIEARGTSSFSEFCVCSAPPVVPPTTVCRTMIVFAKWDTLFLLHGPMHPERRPTIKLNSLAGNWCKCKYWSDNSWDQAALLRQVVVVPVMQHFQCSFLAGACEAPCQKSSSARLPSSL